MKVFPRRMFGLVVVLVWAVVFSTCPAVAADEDIAQKNAAARAFNAAAALQNAGLYARAISRWEAFAKKYPTDERLDRVYYSLGVCQLHAKQYANAVKTFQTVLTKHPSFAKADGAQYNLGMAKYQMALASKKAEDYRAAAEAFGVVASKYSTSSHADNALYNRGEALFAAGATADAAEAYKKLIASHPTSPFLADAYYALGTSQQDLKQDTEAAKTFTAFLANKAFERHELAGEIRLRLGMALFNQKKYDEAEPLFAAVAKEKNFPSADFALLRQGQCRLMTGKVAEAGTLFAGFLKRFPNSDHKKAVQMEAGKCFYSAEKYDDAKKMFEPLVPKQGNVPPEEAYWFARTLLKTNEPQEALKVLDRAIAAGSQDGELAPGLQLTRVNAMYDIPDRRKETPAAYEDFIKKFPSHALTSQATYMAALSALGEGDYAAARRHAEKFLSNPFNNTSKLAPAVMYIAAEGYLLPSQAKQQGGDIAKAEGFYRQLVEKYPDHVRAPRAHLRIGWCLYQNKKYADSAKYLGGIVGKLSDKAHQAEAQLLIGHNLSATDKHKEAVAAYEAALNVKKDWSQTEEALLALAGSLRALDNSSGAAERLKQILKEFPSTRHGDQVLHQLGEIAQEQKNHDEAISYYNQVVTKYPQSDRAAAANYGLASSYFGKKEDDKALPALKKLLAGAGDKELQSRGRYLRGLIYQRQKKYEPAAADLKAFLANGPAADEAADARYTLVICRIHLGQLDEVAKAMDELVKSNPQYAHLDQMYYHLGHALLEKDKQKEAVDAFRSLAEKHADSSFAPESWFHVGQYHETLAEKADADAKKAEIAKATDAYATGLKNAQGAELQEKLRYKLGDMQFRQENYAEAATALQDQLAKHPDGDLAGPARYLAAESLFKLKQFDKALPLFTKIADDKVEKYQIPSLYRAGDCAAKANNWPESQKRYQDLITRFPDFEQLSDARYGLGLALQKQNKLDEARAAFDKVTTETETETAAKARFMIGEIDFGREKYEDAIEQFLMVAVGYPYPDWQAKAQYETGQCFSQLGQKDKAIAAFKKVIEKFPGHPAAADAKTRLKELQK